MPEHDNASIDRAFEEASRLHSSDPVSGETPYERLAAVRPDLADRLARLEEELRRLNNGQ